MENVSETHLSDAKFKMPTPAQIVDAIEVIVGVVRNIALKRALAEAEAPRFNRSPCATPNHDHVDADEAVIVPNENSPRTRSSVSNVSLVPITVR